MRSRLSVILVFFLTLVGSTPVSANDSFARIGVGGLTLMKNTQVRMLEEDLEISTKTVRVHYRFLNEGSSDIRTTVAFPMPPNQLRDDGCEEEPVQEFKVFVDGKPIAVHASFKAEISGRDITDKLRKIGLTEEQIFNHSVDCSYQQDAPPALTAKQAAAVAQLGQEKNHHAQWKVASTYFWEQNFPAGRAIEVRHEYRPLVGSTYSYPYQDGRLVLEELPTAFSGSDTHPDPKEACMDETLRQALKKKAQSLGEGRSAVWVWTGFQDVEYILGTGRNWKGPIGRFTLRIKKESPDQVVSLCFPGQAKKIDPVTLEFTQKNFVPQDRLVIYFYSISASFQITRKTLAAVTPPSVFALFAEPNDKGAHVIALARTNSDVSELMRQLTAAGSPNVELQQLLQVNTCGSKLARADLQIDGSSSGLHYEGQIPKFAEISLPANDQRTMCTVRLR